MTIRGYLAMAVLLAGVGGLLVAAWIDLGYQLVDAAAGMSPQAREATHFLWEAGAIGVYVLLLVATLRWVLQRLANPVRELTAAAEDAIEFGRRLEADGRVPSEIRRLRHTLARLTGTLEDEVEARTVELKETADALRAEVEERRRAEQELDRALAAAVSAAKAKGEFLSVVSHELRTPMHAVLGSMSLLRDSALDESQRRLLETGHAAGSALLQLLNDLLDISRIEAGRMELEAGHVRPVELLDSSAEVFHIAARDKGVLLAVSVAPEVPLVVHGDALRIRQVLLNLVGNAVKFTERGAVRVSAAMSVGTEGQHELRFAVADTGPGIEQEDQHRLFVEFSQLDSSYARKHGGTGLGLAISKRLVEMMGGSIGLSSTPGEGSEFFFSIPCETVSRGGESAPGVAALAGIQVGILADDPAWARAVASCLEPWVAAVELPAAELAPPLQDVDTMIYAGRGGPEKFATTCARLRAVAGPGVRLITVGCHPADLSPDRAAGLAADCVIGGPLKAMTLLHALTGEDCSAPAPGADGPATRRAEGSVLVVEDSVANQFVAEVILTRQGYSVTTADNGAAGVEAARGGGFDLILMDLQMPVMDGFSAVQRIRALPGAAGHVPVVALTANVFPGGGDALLREGFDGVLSKPIRRDQLLAAVADWVSVGRLRRAGRAEAGIESRGLTSSGAGDAKGPGPGNE
jgi:signal transduction histidine kinase/FixJ family two-component response regulator